MTTNCPHCTHPWSAHTGRCRECGCMWTDTTNVPPPPEPPSARDELIANIENVMWTELERQAGVSTLYAERDDMCIDGHPNLTAVAAAVAELFIDSQDDCSHCHSCTAIDGWKLPIEGDDE
jgi:hypothetical protein